MKLPECFWTGCLVFVVSNTLFVYSSESDLVDLEQTLKVMSAGDLKTLAKSFHINGSGLTKPQTCDALLKKSKQSTVTSMFGGGGKGSGAAMLARCSTLTISCIDMLKMFNYSFNSNKESLMLGRSVF